MSFGMFEAAVAGDKDNEHQKKLAKTRLAQAAAEVDQKLGSFLSKATSKSDYIERVRLAENDFRAIVGKYLEGDTGFKAVATKMVDHYVKKVAFTDIKDIRDHVEGLGVKTRKKGDGFTFPAASGAKGYIAVRPNGEIVVETLIGGAGGFQSVYAPNEMDLVERWIEKTVGGSYRMSSRRHASSVYELAGELASQTGRSEQEMEEALILYLEQMESLDGVSYDEDNLPSEARDFLTEAVLHGISAGDFRSAKVLRPSRKARRKRADDHVDAPGVDMSQTMLDGMSGYGDAVAVAFDSNGNAVDLALNWETAQSMANEGYNMQAIRGDGGMSQDDIQRMVDYEKELRRDLYSSRKRRSSKRRVALLPDEFNVDVDSAMAYDAEAGMFVDVQPGGNGYEWNLYWDSGSDYTNVTQDLAESGTAGSLEEAIEQAAHEVSQYSPDSNPFRQSARKRRSNRRTARGVDFTRATYDLFEDGSGDSWYDLVDEDSRSYDSDDLDEVATWLKQDGLYPYDGRHDLYVADSYEDPYTSQRYEDSAALRGFSDDELNSLRERFSSRRASRGRRPFDRVAGGYDWGDKDYQGYPWPDYYTDEDKESEWLEFAKEHPGNLYDVGDTLEDEDFLRAPFGTSVTVPTDDFDGEGNPGEFDLVKGPRGGWHNQDFKADLHWSEIGPAPISGLPENRRRASRRKVAKERFPGTNEMFERAGWQSTDPEKSEWLAPSGYTMYDGSTGSAYYFDNDGVVNSFYTLEDEEFGDDLPKRLTDDEEYQSRLWEY